MQVNVTLLAVLYADFSGVQRFCGSCCAPQLLSLQGWPMHQAPITATLKVTRMRHEDLRKTRPLWAWN